MSDFHRVTIRGLYRKFTNKRCIAGHIGLFSSQPCKGWTFHTWNKMSDEWAMHKTYNFGLFCLHYYGEGKSTQEEGWHLSFAKLKFKKKYGEISINWSLADLYRPDIFLWRTNEKQKTEAT